MSSRGRWRAMKFPFESLYPRPSPPAAKLRTVPAFDAASPR